MDPLEEIASAAYSSRVYRRRKKPPSKGHGPLIAASILLAAIVIAGTIWYVSRPKPAPPPVVEAAPTAPTAPAPALPYDPVQMAKFKAFVPKFAAALGLRHVESLDANQSSDTPLRYTCRYTVNSITGQKAPGSQYPVVFIAVLDGKIEGKSAGVSSGDETVVTATFARVDDLWKLVSAFELTTKHHTSADLFGVPERVNRKTDVTEFYWTHAAVTDAQKTQ